mmetsp:Transcript_87727/g.200489  ORF Transcript_87727/g.200489 Transcript_87727/m.200489 type:complete len:214 (+) Transcript_87727:97-738(+)
MAQARFHGLPPLAEEALLRGLRRPAQRRAKTAQRRLRRLLRTSTRGAPGLGARPHSRGARPHSRGASLPGRRRRSGAGYPEPTARVRHRGHPPAGTPGGRRAGVRAVAPQSCDLGAGQFVLNGKLRWGARLLIPHSHNKLNLISAAGVHTGIVAVYSTLNLGQHRPQHRKVSRRSDIWRAWKALPCGACALATTFAPGPCPHKSPSPVIRPPW